MQILTLNLFFKARAYIIVKQLIEIKVIVLNHHSFE